MVEDTAMVIRQLTARQKPVVHLRPKTMRSSLCCGSLGNPAEKVSLEPFQSGALLVLFLTSSFVLSYLSHIWFLTEIFIWSNF